eukprot:270-Chlamydomonas_euryale.AAC.2
MARTCQRVSTVACSNYGSPFQQWLAAPIMARASGGGCWLHMARHATPRVCTATLQAASRVQGGVLNENELLGRATHTRTHAHALIYTVTVRVRSLDQTEHETFRFLRLPGLETLPPGARSCSKPGLPCTAMPRRRPPPLQLKCDLSQTTRSVTPVRCPRLCS